MRECELDSHSRLADPLQRPDQMRKASRPGKYVWRFATYASTVCRGGNKTDYYMLDRGFAVQFMPEFARAAPREEAHHGNVHQPVEFHGSGHP